MFRFFSICTIVVFGFAPIAFGSGSDLRSHHAVYEMKQIHHKGEKQSQITSAYGVLRYEFRKACDGWTVEHHSAMQMGFSDGQQANMTWDYTSWEARDGSLLRFRTRSKRDGVPIEGYSGEARKQAGQTMVLYSEPQGRREIMPGDTVFPTTHLIQSLEAAQNGETVFNASYFDGGGEDANLDVNTVSTPYKGQALENVKGVLLPKMATWNMMLAFFTPNSSESAPKMEIGARYRLDGVSTLLIQNFGDFALEGKLVEFNYINDPVCQ